MHSSIFNLASITLFYKLPNCPPEISLKNLKLFICSEQWITQNLIAPTLLNNGLEILILQPEIEEFRWLEPEISIGIKEINIGE